MDIDQCLKMLRAMGEKFDNPSFTGEERAEMADEFAAQFDALDRWLSRGGFLPDVWNRARVSE